MLMLLYYYFFNTPPPPGRPFARNWANRMNSPHRCNGRTDGRDGTCHVQIYTQGLWRQIRAAFTINQRNIVPSLPVAGARAVCLHIVYIYTCIIILCWRVCLGIRFFLLVCTIDFVFPSYYATIRRDEKTRFYRIL